MGLIEENRDRPWEDLAEAIIVRACKDYRKAYRRYLKRQNKETEAEVAYQRKFFRSQWFGVLTSANGEVILQKLEEEIRENSNVPRINRKAAYRL